MNLVFNPIRPPIPYDYDLENGYLDEADKYIDEYLLLETFNTLKGEEDIAST